PPRAHRPRLKMPRAGARCANALSFVACRPPELTGRAGINALTLGAPKNGARAAEVVFFFNTELAGGFEYRRKRGGHLLSKMRLISSQLDAYFADGLWLDNARHANAMARRLVAGLTALQGVQLLHPVGGH